jgi:site-specific recombinase XerD
LTTIAQALQLFHFDNRARNLTPATQKWYRWQLQPFAHWLVGQGCTELAELDSRLIRAYLIHCADSQLAGHTLHGIARALRRFCNYCVQDDLLAESPFRNVQMPRTPRKVLEALTPDDVQAVLAACSSRRDRAIVYVLLDTGMRASELVALRGRDVDIQTGAVHIMGKGRKERIGYLSPLTCKKLLRYWHDGGQPGGNDPVFPSKRGQALTRNGLTQIMRRLRLASGVPGCSAHAFRRTFALTMLRNGCDIYTLQHLMGHEDIQVLRQYLAITQQDTAKAHRRYSPVAALLTG